MNIINETTTPPDENKGKLFVLFPDDDAAALPDDKDTIFVHDYFGGCPECGDADYLNVGREHFKCCREHQVCDCIGSNLFSSWKDETEEVWEANRKKLEGYSRVEFLPEGTWSRDLAKRKLEMEAFEQKRIEAADTERAAHEIVNTLEGVHSKEKLRIVAEILRQKFWDEDLSIPF